MARTRRRRASGPRKRYDWVYRGVPGPGTAIGGWSAGSDQPGLASYTSTITGLNSGYNNSRALILLDSDSTDLQVIPTSPVLVGRLPGAARPNHPRTVATRVEGIIYCEPSTWSGGSLMALGWRLDQFEQETDSGYPAVDTNYTMWVSSGAETDQAVNWANIPFLKEGREFKAYSDASATPLMVVHIRWQGRTVLRPGNCLAIYLESESTSVNMRTQPWLRTLVEYSA